MNNNYKEIERKFLVDEANLPDLSERSYQDIVQGYVQNIGGKYIYRLRQVLFATSDRVVKGDKYYQTIKGAGSKEREEYEIELFKDQFHVMWRLCEDMALRKHRYVLTEEDIKNDGIEKEVFLDVYKNDLNGMYTVEVEFNNLEDCDAYVPEPWFGKEVTEDFRYTNFKMCTDGRPMV
jgi:CYTH domain-containing protein